MKDRTDGLLEASRRRLAGSASMPIMADAAVDEYFNALAEEELARFERKLRFKVHFADVLTTLEMEVLCVVGDDCCDHGHCGLSIDAIAEEALVSNARVYSALRAARGPQARPHRDTGERHPHHFARMASLAHQRREPIGT
jgi:hypothetical protein